MDRTSSPDPENSPSTAARPSAVPPNADTTTVCPSPSPIEPDEDLLADYESSTDEIDLVHSRIQSISALQLARFHNLEKLCLRQNEIHRIKLPDELGAKLTELDLYDNQISHISGLESFTELRMLDLSFNNIKHIKNISHLRQLRDLFFVQNSIKRIEGLEGLSQLRNLELGANRIKEIENLEHLADSLEELWLGKNKIMKIKNVSPLKNLKILALPSNHLTSISGLTGLTNLEELYLSHNAITHLSGLEDTSKLRVLDITANQVEHIENIKHLTFLEEFWASNNKLSSFAELRELEDKEHLETVYLEGNPLQTVKPADYRRKVHLALPRVRQIDASMFLFLICASPPTGVSDVHVLTFDSQHSFASINVDQILGRRFYKVNTMNRTECQRLEMKWNEMKCIQDGFHHLKKKKTHIRNTAYATAIIIFTLPFPGLLDLGLQYRPR